MNVRKYLRQGLQEWGFSLFCIDVVASYLVFSFGRLAGHYVQVAQAARYLWSGQDPYGVEFPGSVGLYFFSPTYALYFSSWFVWLPDLWGQALSNGLALGIFVFGLIFFFQVFGPLDWTSIRKHPARHFVWLLLGSEALGAISAYKLELMMAGILLFSAASLASRRYEKTTFILLALMTNWKIHTFLVSLLLLATHTYYFKSWKPWLIFAISFAAAFAAPLLFFSPERYLALCQHWYGSLDAYSNAEALSGSFHSIYLPLKFSLLLPVTLTWVKVGGAVGALVCVALTYAACARWKSLSGSRSWPQAVFFATALGSAYPSLLSPLSQGTAYILSAPLFLAIPWVFAQNKKQGTAFAATAFFLISVVYSDLVPLAARRWAWSHGAKPVGILLVVIAVASLARRKR